MVWTGQPCRAMKSAEPKPGAVMGAPGLRSPAAARSKAGTALKLMNRKIVDLVTPDRVSMDGAAMAECEFTAEPAAWRAGATQA